MALPSMRVGDVEVQGISDGTLKTSLDLVIGMDRAVADKLVGGTADGSLYIPVNNFLIRRGGKTIMIDAGAGNTMQPHGANDPDRVKGNRARTAINLKPYLDRIRRVRDGEEYLGFAPVLAPGHTPGHTCWLLAASGGGFMP